MVKIRAAFRLHSRKLLFQVAQLLMDTGDDVGTLRGRAAGMRGIGQGQEPDRADDRGMRGPEIKAGDMARQHDLRITLSLRSINAVSDRDDAHRCRLRTIQYRGEKGVQNLKKAPILVLLDDRKSLRVSWNLSRRMLSR